MGGLTSQPPGPGVNVYALGAAKVGRKGGQHVSRPRGALGGLTSQPPGRPVSMFSLGSLGDDVPTTGLTTPTLAQPTIVDPQTAAWQQASLQNQQTMIRQLQGDRVQKWVQIAVTASIPLFGALWKLIFGAARE